MRLYDIIKKKRDGFQLNTDEINYVVAGYTKGLIPDYQMSALFMAIYFRDMTKQETIDLTKAMIESGDRVDLSSIEGVKVDKHSTGGVGDTTSLILGPMIGACNVPFVKMSGRGLGHTGGTLDKLESIEGLKLDLTSEEFIRISNEIKFSICSQTANITPADKKFYSLRDVTATVESLPLIASSIMSKKLALGSDSIILDVKVGKGAFMKKIEDAIELSKIMVEIGNGSNRQTVALITNMDQPLGNTVGNSLEVIEAIETLQGRGPKDMLDICLELGSRLLILANKVRSIDEGKVMLTDTIYNGSAINKFREFVENQGGDTAYINNTNNFKKAKHIIEVKSNKDGYVEELDAEKIGLASLKLGAGREKLDSLIDLSVGIVLNKKIGDKIEKDEILAYIHSNNKSIGKAVRDDLLDIYKIGNNKVDKPKLIYAFIDKNGVEIY